MQQREPGPVVGPQVIWSMDHNGKCTLSTGPGLKDLGVKPGELEGQNLFELYRDDASSVNHLHRVLGGEEFTVEREFGSRVLSLYYQPVRDTGGAVVGAIGVSTDVTEQRRLEAEARVSRERVGLLAQLTGTLTREMPDAEALMRVTVQALTDSVAELGIFWLPDTEGRVLTPKAVWWEGVDLTSSWDPRAASRAVEDHLGPTSTLPRSIELAVDGRPAGGLGLMLTELTDRFGLRTALRLPLRARGVLLGVIELARTERHGAFSDDDVAFAGEITERCALALDNALLLDAHRRAREQLVKFQALADASDNLIGIADNDGRLLYVNPSVHGAGIELDLDDVWRTVATQVGGHDPIRIAEALQTQGRWSGDLVVPAKDRSIVVNAGVFVLHHPDTGAALGTAWIGQDVTEVRATEAALVSANNDLEQFKALVEASTDFIAIANLDGSVRYVNPPGRELIGLPADVDVTDTTIADYLTPEGLKASLSIEQPAVIARGHWEGESTLRNHRGPAIPVAIASFLIRDARTGAPFALATVQRDLSERVAAEDALRQLAEERQALLTRLVDAQEAERTRIAADVHDDPIQALAAVDLRLGLLRSQLKDRAPDMVEHLEQVQTSVEGATDRLRHLLFDLEPPDLQNGLAGALRRAAEEVFESTTVRWTVTDGGEPDIPDAARAVAYRIAREAMINVRKHASATRVVVSVSESEGGLRVRVQDDGLGLGGDEKRSPRGHRGLASMQDRAAVAGGRLEVRDAERGGVVVTVWLPAG